MLPVVVGYSTGSSKRAYEIASSYGYEFTVGIAPQEFVRKDEDPNSLVPLLDELLPSALGEVGLDYKWASTERQRAKQKEAFEFFLSLAEEKSLPVVIHCRDAYDDLIRILSSASFSQPLLIHSFFGKEEHADALISSFDALLSINTVRTKDKRKVLAKHGLERFVVETDSPYIARTPYDVRSAIEYISEVKEIPFEEVEKATSLNAATFFRIDPQKAISYRF